MSVPWPEGDALNEELATLVKPSSSKINGIADMCLQLHRQYKLVVHALEKFIVKKSTRDTRLLGLYVLDAVLRKSRAKFGEGAGKDPFASRLAQNMLLTWSRMIEVRSTELPRVGKTLDAWRQKEFFAPELLDEMAAILQAAREGADPAADAAADEQERRERHSRSSPVPPQAESDSPPRDSQVTPPVQQRALQRPSSGPVQTSVNHAADPRAMRDPRRAAAAAAAAAPTAPPQSSSSAIANLHNMLNTAPPSQAPPPWQQQQGLQPEYQPAQQYNQPPNQQQYPSQPLPPTPNTSLPPLPQPVQPVAPVVDAAAAEASFDWGYDDEEDEEEDDDARKEKLRLKLEAEKTRMDAQAIEAGSLMSTKELANSQQMQQEQTRPGYPGAPPDEAAPRRSRFSAPKDAADVAAELAAQGYAPAGGYPDMQDRNRPRSPAQGGRRRSRSRSRERDQQRTGGGGDRRGQNNRDQSNQGFVQLPPDEQGSAPAGFVSVLSTTLRVGHSSLAGLGLDVNSMKTLLREELGVYGQVDWVNSMDNQSYCRFHCRRDASACRRKLGGNMTIAGQSFQLTWAKAKEMSKEREHWRMAAGEGLVASDNPVLEKTPTEMPGPDDEYFGAAVSSKPARSYPPVARGDRPKPKPESYPVTGWTQATAANHHSQMQQQHQPQFQQSQPPPPPPQQSYFNTGPASGGAPKPFVNPERMRALGLEGHR